MRAPAETERGDTLIEILIAIVLIGAMMGVLFASLTMSSTGSNTQKNLATADGILRDYAESTKAAVRTACAGGGSTFTVSYAPTAPQTTQGFSVSSVPNVSTPQACPATTTVAIVQLFVKAPNISAQKELDVAVRTP